MTLTLTFDLLIDKVDRFMPLPVDYLCQFAAKSVHSFSVLLTNGRTDRMTNGQVENIMSPASIDWQRHNKKFVLLMNVFIRQRGWAVAVNNHCK